MLLPQDTSVTILNDRKLKQNIENANIIAPFYEVYKSDKYEVVGIRGNDPHYKSIRTFSTPVVIGEKVVIDIRTGVKGNSEKPTIDQLPVLQTSYGILVGEWITGGDNQIINATDSVIRIYSYWISDIISKQYGLGADEREIIAIIAAAFYLSQRANDVIFDDTLRALCLRRLSRMYSAGYVSQTLSHIPGKFSTCKDLTDTMKNVIGNEKLSDLNELKMMKFVALNVSGIINSDMIFATAIEYPPAFVALVLLMINNNFLQKASPLGRVIANTVTARDKDEINREFKFY